MEQALLHLQRGEEERVRALAAKHEVEVRSVQPRGMDGFTTVAVLLVGLPAAIRHILQSVDDFRHGGQIIDLRSRSGVNVYRSKKLRYGLILVYTPEGSFELHVDPQRSFREVATRLAERLPSGGSAQDVRDAVKAEDAQDPGSIEMEQDPGNEEGV